MAWLGAICGDMDGANTSGSAGYQPLTSSGSAHPTIYERSISTKLSKRAWWYVGASGGVSDPKFRAHHTGGTSTKRFIYGAVELSFLSSTVNAANTFIYTNYQGNVASVSGAVRVVSVANGTDNTKFGFRIQFYNGSTWVNPFTDEATTTRSRDTPYFFRLSITDNGAGAGTGGIVFEVWTLGGAGTNPVYSGASAMTVRPCFEQVTISNTNLVGGKGGDSSHKFYIWELMESDDIGSPSTAQQYNGDQTGAVHCVPHLPTGDANTVWTPVGSCDGSRWRANIDGYEDYTNPGAYNSMSLGSGADQDQLLDIENMAASGEGIDAVMYYALFDSTYYMSNGDLIATREDTGATVALNAYGAGAGVYDLLACKITSPSGATWTPTVFNNALFTAGYRRNAASGATVRAKSFYVCAIGADLVRPSLVADCPPSGRRRYGAVL